MSQAVMTDPGFAHAPAPPDLVSRRQDYVAAFNAGEIEALARLYAPAALRINPGSPDALGRKEIRTALEGHFETFHHQRMADWHVFIEDQVMISVWTWSATHQGVFHDVPASGGAVGVMGASVVWYGNDGLITRECIYWDPYAVLKQLGIGDEPGREIPAHADAPTLHFAQKIEAEAINIRHLRQYHDYLLTGQLQPWLDYMSEDIAWDDQMAPGLAIGKDHSASDFAMLRNAFGDPKIIPLNIWGNNDFVIHQGIFTAKHKGELKGIPASNRTVIVDNIDVIAFRNDKIVKGWTFGNSIEMGYQLGYGSSNSTEQET